MDISPRFSEILPALEYNTPRYFGIPSEFRKSHDPETPAIHWEPIDTLQSIPRIKACFISNISPQPETELSLDFQSPETVEEIRFDGEITQLNFDQLVVPLLNLRLLEIHLSSLEYLDLGNPLFQLNNLECLEVTSTNFSYLHATRANMETIISNAIALLEISFPLLSYLALSIPALFTKEEELTQAVVNFMFRHRTTLKYLNLESPYPVLEDPSGRVLLDPATAKNFEESLDNNNGSLDQITLLSFHYYALYRTCSTEFWRHFLLHQEHLEYCQFWCDAEFKAASPKVIRNNAAILHTVALNNFDVTPGTDGTKRSINCLSFQNCVNLKVIFLKGTAVVPEDRLEATGNNLIPDFENFHLMPLSLEKVKIMNILMSLDDTRFIVLYFMRMKFLHLESIGEEGELGIHFEDLHYLLEDGRVDGIEVVSGVNRLSCEASPGEGGYKTMAKLLFKKQKKSWFRAARNDRGCFEIVDQPEPEDILAHDEESGTTIVEEEDEAEAEDEGQDEDFDTQVSAVESAIVQAVQFQETSQFNRPSRSRTRRAVVARSVASSDFHEIQSIVDKLVDADEANVAEFLK